MLARDSAEKLGWKKPTCVHTHLLMGLQTPTNAEKKTFDENTDLNTQISSKMSKSIPKNCIFVHDNANDIKTKIEASYCPPKQVNGNPILEIAKYVIFAEGKNLNIPRPTKYGGSLTFESYKEVEDAYVKGEVHPLDLKQGVAEALMIILNPVRQFFHKHPQLLERMMKIETTR
jgi:tyrosyl-tRNA synthetase